MSSVSAPTRDQGSLPDFNGRKPKAIEGDKTAIFEITLESMTANLHSRFQRFTGVSEKISAAKAQAESESIKEVDRIQKFTVLWGRALLSDPATRYFVHREQAVFFKQLLCDAKGSGSHPDITAVANIRAKSAKDIGKIPGLLGVGGFGQVYDAQPDKEKADKEKRGIVFKVLRPGQRNDLSSAKVRLTREKRAQHRLSKRREAVLGGIARERKNLLEQNLPSRELKKKLRALKERENKSMIAAAVVGEGKLETGEDFFAMQKIRGQDLREILAQGRLSLDDAAQLMDAVLHPISEAHAAGIIHRDVKPENMKIESQLPTGEKYRAQTMDFGLSRLADSEEEIDQIDETLTAAGTILGSPLYMSPEQAFGNKGTENDLYALAVIWVEAVTGVNPRCGKFNTSNAVEIASYMKEEKNNPALLLEGLSAYGIDAVEVGCCFMRGDASAASALLKDLAAGKRGPLLRRGLVKAKMAWEKARNMSKTQAVVLAALLASLIGAGLAWWATRSEKNEDEKEPDLINFVMNNNGIPDLKLKRPIVDDNMEKTFEEFLIQSGVAFYTGKGEKKRLFATVGAYSGRGMANFERRNIEAIYKEHLKSRRAINFFDGEPGKDPGFSTMNDGHNFVFDGGKTTPYSAPGGILSDSLLLREFSKTEKTFGQHYQDPAYIRLVGNLPERPDEVDVLNSEVFQGMKEQNYKSGEWNKFLTDEMKRMRDTLGKKRSENGAAPKKADKEKKTSILIPDQLRNQFTDRAQSVSAGRRQISAVKAREYENRMNRV